MMSKEQQQQLDGNLRQGGLDTNGDVRDDAGGVQ